MVLKNIDPESRVFHFRKQLLIYPKLQVTMIAVNLALFTAFFGIMSYFVSQLFTNLRYLGLDSQLEHTHTYFRYLESQNRFFYTVLGVTYFFGIVSCFFFSLFFSHKIAGPILRIRLYFAQIVEKGKRENNLNFRDGDFFSDLPGVVNGALSSIEKNKSANAKDNKAA